MRPVDARIEAVLDQRVELDKAVEPAEPVVGMGAAMTMRCEHCGSRIIRLADGRVVEALSQRLLGEAHRGTRLDEHVCVGEATRGDGDCPDCGMPLCVCEGRRGRG